MTRRHPLSKDGRHWAVGKLEKPASKRVIRRQARVEISDWWREYLLDRWGGSQDADTLDTTDDQE